MSPVKYQNPKAVRLFHTKFGGVQAVVIGPEIGWRWRVVKYFHCKRSARIPGGWDEITDNWGKHNASLIECAVAVEEFLEHEEELQRLVEKTWAQARNPQQQQALLEEIRAVRKAFAAR